MNRPTITAPTVFQQLAALRKAVKNARAELATIRASIRVSKSRTDWNPAEDLKAQLGNALVDLDSAIDYLKPLSEHIDSKPGHSSAAQGVQS